MSVYEKLIRKTMDLQRQITQAKLTRRDLLKMGLLSATTGMLLPISGLSLRAARAAVPPGTPICPEPGRDLISPFTRPWREEMPRLVEKQPVTDNDPRNCNSGNGGGIPDPNPIGTLSGGDSKVRCLDDFPALGLATPYGNLSHQGWGKSTPLIGNHPPQKFYELHEKQFNHVWHDDLPAGNNGQPAWGFDGLFPERKFTHAFATTKVSTSCIATMWCMKITP